MAQRGGVWICQRLRKLSTMSSASRIYGTSNRRSSNRRLPGIRPKWGSLTDRWPKNGVVPSLLETRRRRCAVGLSALGWHFGSREIPTRQRRFAHNCMCNASLVQPEQSRNTLTS